MTARAQTVDSSQTVVRPKGKAGILVLAASDLYQDTSIERTAPSEFMVIKYGLTETKKNNEKSSYEFTPEDADKVIADFTEKGRDCVIDFEHQSLSGNKAPAAGWIDSLTKTAEGLVAHIKYWTDEAKQLLEDGAYRYFSPVLYLSKKRPLALHSVAITNVPATLAIDPLVASDAILEETAVITLDEDQEESAETLILKEERDMAVLQDISKLLGLELVKLADGTETIDEVSSFDLIKAKLMELLTAMEEMKECKKLHDVPDLNALTLKIKGLVPATELLALTDKLATIDAEKAVLKAFSDKKLVEAQRAWALKYAKESPQAFSDFMAVAPAIAPAPASEVTATVAESTKPEEKPEALSDDALKAEYAKTEALRDEFRNVESFMAYTKANAAGKVRILKKSEVEVK